jgi:FdhD protein
VQDWVADEVPVALEFNGISHAVMLATPLDLEDFALGFSLSEGILDAAARALRGGGRPAFGPRHHAASAGIERGVCALKERRRTMAGRTGCGLCGTESLAHVSRELPVLGDAVAARQRQAIARAMSQFQSLQTLQQATGAVHAAAWCSAEGEVMWLREDVGRHNALDKLIGALVEQRRRCVGRLHRRHQPRELRDGAKDRDGGRAAAGGGICAHLVRGGHGGTRAA